MNRGWTAKCLTICLAALLLCAPCVRAEQSPADTELALTLLERIAGGQYEEAVSAFSDELRAALDAETLEQTWAAILAQFGAYKGVLSTEWQQVAGAQVVLVHTAFEYSGAIWTIAIAEGIVSGFWIQPEALPAEAAGEAAPALPAGVRGEEIVLRAGTQTETHGTLLLPAGEGPFPTVVLIHGSGPNDRDETIYANKPFRDIAEGLAQRGIASVRYDKFTHAHADLFADPAYAAAFTVRQEYEDDLLAALAWIAGDERLGDIYLIGHSQGAMLLPRLMRLGGAQIAGGISLAGSPRQLWQISLSQNEMVLATLTGEAYAQARAQVDAEIEKANRLPEMSEEELAAETVFGLPARYAREMAAHDALETALALKLPLLILQGEVDFQVSAAEDYGAWRAGLEGQPFAEFRLYPRLNHLFMDTGEEVADIANYQAVYQIPATVDAQVIADIADFILAR